MTAVASPPNLISLPRNGWSNLNGNPGGLNAMTPEEVSRMLIPRKSLQRQNSGSSISSSTSSTSTISATSTTSNGAPVGEAAWSAARKKPARGLWPAAKSEPVSGISTARTQSVAASAGPSAASAISALQNPSSVPPQHMIVLQGQQNGAPRAQGPPEAPAILHLLPINGTFERKTITVPYLPEVLRIGRQTNQKTLPTPTNGFFDSKVLSRQHAEIWAERGGKIWIRDVKSSNGTFVNGARLSQENQDSEPHILREQDVLELGIDIVSEDQKTVVHHKVAARVEFAGIYGANNMGIDLNLADLDPSNGGLMSQPMSQNMRRSLSQASNGASSRYSGAGGSNMNLAAYHTKWLQPVSMEQVVKKLAAELKNARLQSQDLEHTGQFVDMVLNDTKPDSKGHQQNNSKSSPTKADSFKSRFSAEPPAPPPSQPLPEKPSDAEARLKNRDFNGLPPVLRRMETERPMGSPKPLPSSDSPTKLESSHHILNLVEALTAAQKELSSQTERLKTLEDLLAQEREARVTAEARVRGFEETNETVKSSVNEKMTDDITTTILPADPKALQTRLDLMVAEMEDMKQNMERFKQRAEAAEDASSHDRQTLADMVSKLRREQDKRDEKRRKRAEARRKRAATDSVDGQTNALAVEESESEEEEVDGEIQSPLVQEGLRLARAQHDATQLSPEQLQELQKVISRALGGDLSTTQIVRRSRQEQLVQSAPYASIVGVVLLGVGLMTYLNGWQKAMDR